MKQNILSVYQEILEVTSGHQRILLEKFLEKDESVAENATLKVVEIMTLAKTIASENDAFFFEKAATLIALSIEVPMVSLLFQSAVKLDQSIVDEEMSSLISPHIFQARLESVLECLG